MAGFNNWVCHFDDTNFLFNKTLGTRLCFHKGRNKEWEDAEDFARSTACQNEMDDSVSTYKVSFSFHILL